jgi:hypothetical protein
MRAASSARDVERYFFKGFITVGEGKASFEVFPSPITNKTKGLLE